MDTMKQIESIQKVQKSIDDLLEMGCFGLKGIQSTNQWLLEPLHQGDSCSVGFVHIATRDAGPCHEHIHANAKEYLIVVTGSVVLNINGQDVRLLKEGDCGVVQPGELHFSRPMEDDTKLIYACIPADSGMDSVIKALEGKCQMK